MNEIPFFQRRIKKICLNFPPDGEGIPEGFKKAAMKEIIWIRAISLIAIAVHFEILSKLNCSIYWYLTLFVWWIFFIAANTDDYFKVYDEFWEIRRKKKMGLTKTILKIAGILINDRIDKSEKRRGKK